MFFYHSNNIIISVFCSIPCQFIHCYTRLSFNWIKLYTRNSTPYYCAPITPNTVYYAQYTPNLFCCHISSYVCSVMFYKFTEQGRFHNTFKCHKYKQRQLPLRWPNIFSHACCCSQCGFNYTVSHLLI